MKRVKVFVSIAVLIILQSCEGEADLGKLQVKNAEDIYIRLWQEREFDSATALYFQIYREPDFPITTKKYLHGTDTYETDTDNFFAESVNGIVYLTFHSQTEVSAIYDLKSSKGYPHFESDWRESFKVADQLLLELKKTKPELTSSWN